MLILTRKLGESINIGDDIKITLLEIHGNQVRIGIEAPKDTKIYREEVFVKIMEENKLAAQSKLDAVTRIALMIPDDLKNRRGKK